MTLTHRHLRTYALAGWTLLVWVPRVRNVVVDDMGGPAMGIRLAWSALFLTFAVGAVVVGVRQSRAAVAWMGAFVVWTIGFWSIRAVQIAIADHSAGFIVVHTVLAVVSIGLAVWSWPGVGVPRPLQRRPAAPSPPG